MSCIAGEEMKSEIPYGMKSFIDWFVLFDGIKIHFDSVNMKW